jgi:competence ComEA-like helix-hairpin-helix protein
LKNFKSHFRFNKQERSGIFFLLFFLILIQIGYYLYRSNSSNQTFPLLFDSATQAKIDSLKKVMVKRDSLSVYPFNPNFITDFKGYTLGMSVEEIDRLHAFRATDNFVNSAEAFQEVTKISDSLLRVISPFFKFPEWTQNKKSNAANRSVVAKVGFADKNIVLKDLNTATEEELKRINGIGEKLSARIIKFRNRLGGFLVDEQLYDVYYLDEEVVERVLTEYKVITKPDIAKINVNTATVEELSKLIYIQKQVAVGIVNYRNLNGSINSLNELLIVKDFPVDKIDRIALYLSL